MIIKDIPNRLECAYCVRNKDRGGECHSPKYSDAGCLGYKLDPKGCIRSDDLKIPVKLYSDIPPLNTWWDGWELNGVETQVRVTCIKGLKWDTRKGKLIIHCRCDYYVNEYHDDYINPKTKPALKLVK